MKYWLPKNVILKEGQTGFNKETKLTFIDTEYGEFISSFRNIERAKASCHPKSIYKRQIERVDNLAKPEIRQKAQNTMFKKYGVKNALESKVFLNKSQQTLLKNYGVTSPMDHVGIRQKLKQSFITNLGVDNPMKDKGVKDRLIQSNLKKYGVRNPMQDPEIREKYYKSISEDGKFLSSGEKEIKDFLNTLDLETYSSYIGGANPHQIDIKIKNTNICIEYNGCYWHSEKFRHNGYHLEKTEDAKKAGLKLFHIFDYEWENRPDQVKSFLRSSFNKNEHIIYARNTKLKEVNKKEAKKFLDDYHILGKCNFKKAYGLYYKEELLSILTIGHHHRGLKQHILNRYCGKTNYTVIGGLSKLTKAAFNDFGEIFTWIDYRWSNGENWIKNGWKLVKKLQPDYFYYNSKNRKIVSKQQRKKSNVKTPSNTTEHEHALNEGLLRVYDCGKLKLVFNNQ